MQEIEHIADVMWHEWNDDPDAAVFAAGDMVYIVERNRNGAPVHTSGYMFLARVGAFVIASACIEDIETPEETLARHADDTRDNYETGLCVFPFEDCFASQDEARARMEGE